MIIMGLDYGAKTVGVALSDELLITAIPYETIFRKSENKLRKTLARIQEIISEKNVTHIILGNPVHINGENGLRVEKTQEFKKMLESRTGIEVVMYDERLTTVFADEILRESNIKKEDRKKYIDSIAASIILRDYMNNIGKEDKFAR